MRLINILKVSFKGFFLSKDLISKSDQTFEDLALCEKNISKDKTPKVMINVIKEAENGRADLDAYTNKVIFELFPVVGTSVFYAGVALSDGWSQVVLHNNLIFWLWKLFNRLLWWNMQTWKVCAWWLEARNTCQWNTTKWWVLKTLTPTSHNRCFNFLNKIYLWFLIFSCQLPFPIVFALYTHTGSADEGHQERSHPASHQVGTAQQRSENLQHLDLGFIWALKIHLLYSS